eukprot:COSAG01_NODE_29131_length_644_cov_2.856881_1_plen_113_part_10
MSGGARLLTHAVAVLPLCERRWEEVRRVLDDKCVADFLEVKREAEKQVRPTPLMIQSRWVSKPLVFAGILQPRRLNNWAFRCGRTALSLAPQLAGLALAGGVGPGVEDGGAGA